MELAKLLLFLSVCMVVLLVPLGLQMKWRQIPLWKSLPVSLISTIGGTVAAKVWFYLENGCFDGISFFGVVFLGPLLFLLAALLVRLPFSEVADVCAAAECIVLAMMKVLCRISGCCGGRFLFELSNGVRVYFPSQIAEVINAVILLVVLMVLSYRQKNRGGLYPTFMILYGATRFVLNFFRRAQTPFLLGLAPGAFWSICAIVIGVIWLLVRKKLHQK